MTGHDLLLIANSIICGGIALRVMFFQRNGSRHRRGGWIAYFLIVAAASIPLRCVLIPVPLPHDRRSF
jgi:hypothetical protein